MYNIIILGIIVSVIYYEITDISPGGIIVPGYIAIYITQPERIILTVLLSVLTLIIVNFISNYTILYGRRKFGVMIIISFIIKYAMQVALGNFYLPSILIVGSIGYIIPGVIAQDIGRQGFIKTISSMLLVGSIVYLIDILVLSGGLI